MVYSILAARLHASYISFIGCGRALASFTGVTTGDLGRRPAPVDKGAFVLWNRFAEASRCLRVHDLADTRRSQ